MSKPVILGAGLAGLSVALALAPMPVVIISPRPLGEGCSSAWAQGGIAAAVGGDDSAAVHAADTLAAGAGLNDAAIVRQTTEDGRGVIEKLLAYGAPFDRDEKSDLGLGLEAAHSRRRIVHAKDATGRAIMQAVIKTARATPSIEIIENAVAQDVIVDDGVAGVVVQRDGAHNIVPARQVVVATGGASALWRDTTNPHENWGSGLVLAARAGATLGDLEFMQFHPTAIDIGRDPMPLATEALRGEGAVLVDDNGARFIDELQPRDIVARAIWQKITGGGKVFLDARHLGNTWPQRFPAIYSLCIGTGIDPARAALPVRPAAHYHMGGIVTDARGRSDVSGLWACGEAACTGLHGANRLASNSLLEAASFGARVAQDIQDQAQDCRSETVARSRPAPGFTTAPFDNASRRQADSFAGQKITAAVRAAMSDGVGVVRDQAGLERALATLLPLTAQSDMAVAGAMIAASALRRQESRGAHYRRDFPNLSAEARRGFFRLSDLEVFR